MPSSNATTIQSLLTGLPYGLVHLNMATIAYTHGKDTVGDVGDFQQALAGAPPVPQDAYPGTFNLCWGPKADLIDANLAYMAIYVSNGEPVFGVVGIRGTDIGVIDKIGLLTQIFDDLEIANMVPATKINPLAPSGASIAEGTAAGLSTICNLSAPMLSVPTTPPYNPPSGSVTLQSAIESLFGTKGAYPNLPLVVTGHSLGGCQTTVMALQILAWQLGIANVIPQPFAPPTAGNAAFASWYGNTFPNGVLWANPHDIVPSAFANMAFIKQNLWALVAWPALGVNAMGPSFPPSTLVPITPEEVDNDFINYWFNKLATDAGNNGYTQPTAGWQELADAMPTQEQVQSILQLMKMNTANWTTWLAMLIWQHFPPAYSLLLAQVDGVLPYAGNAYVLPPYVAPSATPAS